MNTKLLMVASSLIMAFLGVAGSFAPSEILASFGVLERPLLSLLVQITGALFLAFAMLNWMAKDSVIGGIYNRPIAMANALHFFVGAMALIKGLIAGHTSGVVWLAAGIYALFAAAFGTILFRSPR